MELIVNGELVNNQVEHEIISGNQNGFQVTVTFKGDRESEVHNNCTEVHSRYNDSDRIAFESDIHNTGLTCLIKDIETVDIQVANKIEENF